NQLGDLARVATAAEGAIDRRLPRLRRQQRHQLRRQHRLVLAHKRLQQSGPEGGSDGEGLRGIESHDCWVPAAARPSAISGAAASSSSSCLAQASAFQISRYSPAPITTQLPSRPAWSISGLGTRIRPAESSFSSKEPPWKRRRSWRASRPKGLCGERKRSESCSNSSVVCTQTQGSKPLERTMPSAREARNLEGTVRRSFESRLCS